MDQQPQVKQVSSIGHEFKVETARPSSGDERSPVPPRRSRTGLWLGVTFLASFLVSGFLLTWLHAGALSVEGPGWRVSEDLGGDVRALGLDGLVVFTNTARAFPIGKDMRIEDAKAYKAMLGLPVRWPPPDPGGDAKAAKSGGGLGGAEGGKRLQLGDASVIDTWRLRGRQVVVIAAATADDRLEFVSRAGHKRERASSDATVIRSGILAALRQAEYADVRRLGIVYPPVPPYELGDLDVPADQAEAWKRAVFQAVDEARAHLQAVDQVQVLVLSGRGGSGIQQSLKRDLARIGPALAAFRDAPEAEAGFGDRLVASLETPLRWTFADSPLEARGPGAVSASSLGLTSEDLTATYLPPPGRSAWPLAAFAAGLVLLGLFRCRSFATIEGFGGAERGRMLAGARWRIGLAGLVGAAAMAMFLWSVRGAWKAWGLPAGSLEIALVLGGLVAGCAGGLVCWWVMGRVPLPAPEKRAAGALAVALHTDRPIASVEEDRLGFAPLAKALRMFFDNPATRPPVVLSVNGPWGSGKSSMMRMLDSELERTGRFTRVWFNAWQYHQEEQILAAFLQAIVATLRASSGWLTPVRLAWVRVRRFSFAQFFWHLLPIGVFIGALVGLEPGQAPAAGAGGDGQGEMWSAVLGLLATGGGLAALVQAFRLAKQFPLKFKALFEVSNYAERIGFIEKFNREFKLYREAVGGDRRFMVFIDDLDRCPPDKVVEVLKAINLIITCAEGDDKTFFVLGYDPKYIVRSIEVAFREYAQKGEVVDKAFGPEYLKKMVTLSLSVPSARVGSVTRLIEALDDKQREGVPEDPRAAADREAERERAWKARPLAWRIGRRLAVVPRWIAPALTAAAAVTLLAGAGVMLFSRLAQAPAGKNEAAPTAAALGGQAPVPMAAERLPVIAAAPELVAHRMDLATGLTLLGVAGLLAVLGALLMVVTRPARTGVLYGRSEDDEAFIQAVKACRRLLPLNPRDVVRTVNRVRLLYLLQSEDVWKEPREKAEEAIRTAIEAETLSADDEAAQWVNPVYDGEPLEARACVTCTVLQQRYPATLDAYFLEQVLPAAIERVAEPRSAAKVFAALREQDLVAGQLAKDVQALEEEQDVGFLIERASLARFASLTRHAMDYPLAGEAGRAAPQAQPPA